MIGTSLGRALAGAAPTCDPARGLCAGDADRAALEAVLAQPRFAAARFEPGLLERWAGEIWERLLDLLGAAGAERYAAGGRAAFFAAVALGAAALAIWALRRRSSRRPRTAPLPARGEPPPVPPDPDPALAAGDLASALGAAFELAAGALERAGVIPRGRALTNREMAGRVAVRAPAAAEDFGRLAAAVDRSAYGGRPPLREEAQACAAAARRVAALAAGGAR